MYLIKLCEFTDALLFNNYIGEGTGLDTKSAVQMVGIYCRMSCNGMQ